MSILSLTSQIANNSLVLAQQKVQGDKSQVQSDQTQVQNAQSQLQQDQAQLERDMTHLSATLQQSGSTQKILANLAQDAGQNSLAQIAHTPVPQPPQPSGLKGSIINTYA